jgi:2-polyprenyl-3-methyl-5-hydroxy-6-metoxy-1,4-benzoquinol methylase
MNEMNARNDYRIYASTMRSEIIQFVPQTANRILDVGCSVGNFGEILKSERSAEVWGVEIDEAAASIAATKLDKIICGAFDVDLNLPLKYFDCIIFNDVLEHMVDPNAALVYAKQLLRNGGKIVASIPNVRYFDNLWSLLMQKIGKSVDIDSGPNSFRRFYYDNSGFLLCLIIRDYDIDLVKEIDPLG